MRRFSSIALFALGCGGNDAAVDALPAFDPDAVIYADSCEPFPEFQACVEANPVTFQPGNAPAVQAACGTYGYACGTSADWISPAAAECIAETDSRISPISEKRLDISCGPVMNGPIWGVYDMSAIPPKGIGVHAATGRIIWYDDGTGTFS
jgi:hypothetical protein